MNAFKDFVMWFERIHFRNSFNATIDNQKQKQMPERESS